MELFLYYNSRVERKMNNEVPMIRYNKRPIPHTDTIITREHKRRCINNEEEVDIKKNNNVSIFRFLCICFF